MKNTDIKLIALDIDKTLLATSGSLSDRNRETVLRAIRAGYEVVPATGRPRSSIPREISAIEGLRYLVSSNGANVCDTRTGESLYERFIPSEGLDAAWDVLTDESLMKEFFYQGRSYMDEKFYRNMKTFGMSEKSVKYLQETRTPVPDGVAFLAAHKHEIETVDILFSDEDTRQAVWKKLRDNPHIETTTSLGFNVEFGAIGVSKADALAHLCRHLGVAANEVLACGDNDNDAAMLRFAGIGVAMKNATEAAKAVADFITAANDEDGVADAIEKYCRI